MTLGRMSLVLGCLLGVAACGDDDYGLDGSYMKPNDLATAIVVMDLGDMASTDLAGIDLSSTDLATEDLAPSDLGPDLLPADMGEADLGDMSH